ncbi:hypothetical protein BKA83DRAFT_4122890 [Pisolithus microcarpus]|nr:hypothetical protein BKA83DRAFT_4122890 [Pisolithus microcarpus]
MDCRHSLHWVLLFNSNFRVILGTISSNEFDLSGIFMTCVRPTPGPVDIADKLLELKFRTAVTTSIILVALIWVIIQTVGFICDGNDLLANMSWKSINVHTSCNTISRDSAEYDYQDCKDTCTKKPESIRSTANMYIIPFESESVPSANEKRGIGRQMLANEIP